MSFFELFKNIPKERQQELSGLHYKLESAFPDIVDEKRIELACIAGLLARVAFVDMEIHANEKELIQKLLIDKFDLSEQIAEQIASLAIDEVRELSILENHLYAYPLNEIWDNQQKYHLLQILFALAASDGSADNDECEEIRLICESLRLEHKYFVAARATVKDNLAALKK